MPRIEPVEHGIEIALRNRKAALAAPDAALRARHAVAHIACRVDDDGALGSKIIVGIKPGELSRPAMLSVIGGAGQEAAARRRFRAGPVEKFWRRPRLAGSDPRPCETSNVEVRPLATSTRWKRCMADIMPKSTMPMMSRLGIFDPCACKAAIARGKKHRPLPVRTLAKARRGGACGTGDGGAKKLAPVDCHATQFQKSVLKAKWEGASAISNDRIRIGGNCPAATSRADDEGSY